MGQTEVAQNEPALSPTIRRMFTSSIPDRQR